MGKIEFTQQSQFDILNIEQALTGRSFNNLYGIHKVKNTLLFINIFNYMYAILGTGGY